MKHIGHIEQALMDELERGQMSTSEIARATVLTVSMVRKVLRGLESQGLVESRVYGTARVYQLARTKRAA